MPGTPSASRELYWARLKALFQGADPRVCAAFWLFGLINNVLYVIILSSALDLVGPDVPKGVVLLADVIPSFITKLCAPYFIHKIPYNIRVLLCCALSACGMLVIALTPQVQDAKTISIKMCGVMLASLSSGGGELSFLSLTHYYGHFALASWGSGTGGAGLVGAGAYAILTTTFQFSPRNTLLIFSFLPVIMLLSFFAVLPRGPLRSSWDDHTAYEALEDDDAREEEDGDAEPHHEHDSLMLPLLLVYIAEYTINQGVAPTLLFPLSSSPFDEYRSFYSTYNAIYQVGVFISRSSTPFIRIHHLYLPSSLQVANLIVLTLHGKWFLQRTAHENMF
ncbi:battenin CLN3 protein [Kalmusia sp. IMI 367209]|nr:battenin CLN3 protein [Kalmusia sp. IMI 367209]